MSVQQQSNNDDESNPINQEVIDELREAGASDIFIEVIQLPVSEFAGVNYNSARQEVLKYIRWAEDGGNNISDFLSYGGGFFQNLFDDDNPEWYADGNNRTILVQVRKQCQE